MRKIIQFTHPGTQFKLSKRSKKNGQSYVFKEEDSGIRAWNFESSHHRKFLRSKGEIGSSNEFQDLLFWGEWEAQAKFELLDNKTKFMPNAIYSPFYQETESKCHTTDPFVFDSTFYYSICKQEHYHRLLGSLKKGDIILFGSSFKECYLLDTFFVVNEKFHAPEFLEEQNYFPFLMKQTGPLLNGLYKKSSKYKIYTGIMLKDNSKLFSFVPAKTYEKNKNGFEPLKLCYEKFSLTCQSTLCKDLNKAGCFDLDDFLRKLEEEMTKQNFEKCVEFSPPRIVEGKDSFKNPNNSSNCLIKSSNSCGQQSLNC